jgi:hypothetical protein
MRNEDEDLLYGNDEDQPSSAWWPPSSLLTPDVTSITAFTIALISISTFGIGSTMLVAQSVLGAPAGPSDLRALNLTGAVILLGMGARRDPARPQGFPAGRAVVRQWARHLADAAAAVAALSTVLNTAALIAALLRHAPADALALTPSSLPT